MQRKEEVEKENESLRKEIAIKNQEIRDNYTMASLIQQNIKLFTDLQEVNRALKRSKKELDEACIYSNAVSNCTIEPDSDTD